MGPTVAGYLSFIPRSGFAGVVSLAWVLVGIAVLVAILAIGLRINRRKRTARLAVRLAEAYRVNGRFEVAERLYRVPTELDQNIEHAREGLERNEASDRTPVLEEGLAEDAQRSLGKAREHLEAVFAKRGLDIELPPIDDETSDG